MKLKTIIYILDITKVYKIKVKTLICEDGHLLSDSIFNKLCYYYLTIENTLAIIEKLLLDSGESGEIKDMDSLVELRNSLNKCTEAEKLLEGYVSLASH